MTRIASQDAPAETVGITVADELVVHGWDVARATGQPYQPSRNCWTRRVTFLGMFASPDARRRRRSRSGRRVAAADDALLDRGGPGRPRPGWKAG